MAAATDTEARGLATCPNCGSKATARGQLMCLECGTRMALVFRRTTSWKAPLAIIIAVVAVLAIAALLALSTIRHNADDEVGTTHPASVQIDAATAGHVAPT